MWRGPVASTRAVPRLRPSCRCAPVLGGSACNIHRARAAAGLLRGPSHRNAAATRRRDAPHSRHHRGCSRRWRRRRHDGAGGRLAGPLVLSRLARGCVPEHLPVPELADADGRRDVRLTTPRDGARGLAARACRPPVLQRAGAVPAVHSAGALWCGALLLLPRQSRQSTTSRPPSPALCFSLLSHTHTLALAHSIDRLSPPNPLYFLACCDHPYRACGASVDRRCHEPSVRTTSCCRRSARSSRRRRGSTCRASRR